MAKPKLHLKDFGNEDMDVQLDKEVLDRLLKSIVNSVFSKEFRVKIYDKSRKITGDSFDEIVDEYVEKGSLYISEDFLDNVPAKHRGNYRKQVYAIAFELSGNLNPTALSDLAVDITEWRTERKRIPLEYLEKLADSAGVKLAELEPHVSEIGYLGDPTSLKIPKLPYELSWDWIDLLSQFVHYASFSGRGATLQMHSDDARDQFRERVRACLGRIPIPEAKESLLLPYLAEQILLAWVAKFHHRSFSEKILEKTRKEIAAAQSSQEAFDNIFSPICKAVPNARITHSPYCPFCHSLMKPDNTSHLYCSKCRENFLYVKPEAEAAVA